MKQSPCLNCITVAICRHKFLDDLLDNCPLVVNYTEFLYSKQFSNRECYESENYNFNKLVKVFQALQPTRWTLDEMYSGR